VLRHSHSPANQRAAITRVTMSRVHRLLTLIALHQTIGHHCSTSTTLSGLYWQLASLQRKKTCNAKMIAQVL
jgi:hypothetical protein